MPNGGVPLHMVLKPKLGEGYVFYAQGKALHLITVDEWEKHGREATPLLSITPAELRVLASFVLHWAGDESARPIYSWLGVDVEFDC